VSHESWRFGVILPFLRTHVCASRPHSDADHCREKSFRSESDESLFTLKKSLNIPTNQFVLKLLKMDKSIIYSLTSGEYRCDINDSDRCNADTAVRLMVFQSVQNLV
jgi:hypothetical protein